MATAESVKAKINNLIAKANSATGKSDTNLTSGINSLIDGFGKGETAEEWNGTGIVIAPIGSEQPKTFTIGGASYVTENRMTWYEWCKRVDDLNTDNFRCANTSSYVYEAESNNVVTYANGIEVLGGQEITEGAEYLIKKGA